MGLLDGFEVVESINGILTMTITKNGIAFNKTVLEKLGCPENVVALINKYERQFAIQPCTSETLGHRDFYNPNRKTSYGVRWNNHDLRSTIESMMGWDLSQQGWKVRGSYSEEDMAVLFDLNTAEMLPDRNASKKGVSTYDEDIPF